MDLPLQAGLALNNTSYAISPERAARFEKGVYSSADPLEIQSVIFRVFPYYAGIYALEMNKGGMRSPEMYYIKAECLARKGEKLILEKQWNW